MWLERRLLRSDDAASTRLEGPAGPFPWPTMGSEAPCRQVEAKHVTPHHLHLPLLLSNLKREGCESSQFSFVAWERANTEPVGMTGLSCERPGFRMRKASLPTSRPDLLWLKQDPVFVFACTPCQTKLPFHVLPCHYQYHSRFVVDVARASFWFHRSCDGRGCQLQPNTGPVSFSSLAC